MTEDQKNKHSLLILFEGETEAEFYKAIFDLYEFSRKIRRNYSNLKGIYSLNEKVKNRIESYLSNDAYTTLNSIHVFVAYDREGPRHKATQLDLRSLTDEFIYDGSRISSIHEIVATQDLESWFFHDLDGIYKYLRVPQSKRNFASYNNPEATNNRVLSHLFHRFDKHYQKGRKVNGFVAKLNLEKIVDNVHELKKSISIITALC